LGFAPRGWDNLVGFLAQKKANREIAEKAGLIAPRRSGDGYYDRFRDRIIFPIFDARKQVIGFGGRVMDDSVPKYLNSPETPVFSKGRNLYGLHLTKGACRSSETVFMVEGYFDLIALYQHGIKNVAATLGTSLTTDHVKLLRGFAKRAILVFDSDEAGAKAAGRSIPLFKKENVDVRVMSLPKGHDPDTFVFEFGADAFAKASEKALGVMAFLTEAAVAKHGLSVEGKLSVLKEMKEHLAGVADPAARSLYTTELAQRIGVDENAVSASIRRTSAKNENTTRTSETMPVEPEGWFGATEEGAATVREKPPSKTERKIVAMMLQCPEMLPDIVTFNVLDYFENENLKSIGKAILLNHDANGPAGTEPSDLFSLLENDTQRSLAASLAMEDEDYWIESESRKRQLIFQFIESGRLRDEKALIEKIKDAESKNDMELLSKLLELSERQKLALACQEQRMALLRRTSNVNSLK
jgi:DNA primase